MVEKKPDMMQHRVVLICNLALLLVLVLSESGLAYESHTETYSVSVPYQDTYCYNRRCGYRCTGCGCYRRCRYTRTCYQCCVVTRSKTETRTRCQALWTGPFCNIPYCTQKCPAGQTCVPGNKCQCVTAGQTRCKAEGCSSPKLSCYPGTCAGSTCTCPTQFNDTNCLTILQTPGISECRVKLFTGTPEVEVASANCAVEGHDPEVTWVGRGSFSRIEPSWKTTYLYPYDPIPPAETSHVKDAKFGITRTKASVTVTPSSSSTPITKDITPECKDPRVPPAEHVDCRTKAISWSEFGIASLSDNATLDVTVSSKLGGYKILHELDKREEITGLESTERKVRFKVDVKPPIHCRQTKSCDDPAISVSLDAVQKPVVEFEFTNWFDLESGIRRYEVEIYELLKSSSGAETILVRAQRATDKRLIDGNINRTQYTFPAPGVYSVELTVFDNANNPSKARKIILYDRENHVTISKEHLFVVEQASKESGYRWITGDLRNDGGRTRLRLSWRGRYSNRKHIQEGWLSRVEPWNSGIDDDYTGDGGGGNRTIHKIDNSNGTVFYRLAFLVDKLGGLDLSTKGFADGENITDDGDLPQSTWVSLSAGKLEKDIWMPALTASDTVVIWIQAIDIVGYYVEEQILVRFDKTEPVLDGDSPTVLRQGTPDPYHSSIVIKAKDEESGIAEVRYYIIDASLRVNITSGSSPVRMLRRSTTGTSRTSAVCNSNSDTNCYCINGGECFLKEIVVEIDHCAIDKHYADDRIMQLHYVVVNQAGNTVQPLTPFVLKFDGGKPICRAVTAFTTGTILAIVIGMLILLILLVLVALMLVRWKQNKHPIPDRVRTFATSVRQKVTNTEKVHDSEGHVIYRAKTRRGRQTEDDDDIYVDGSDPGGWRVNRDQVEMAETLAQGRFAIVKKAYLKKGGEKKTVAAKFLPSGASDADKAMLKSKIAFHGNRVPPHDNIVRLIGVLDDGPVMLLEFCDLTLKDWLSGVGKVDSDALENMLNFTLQIACGMEHLHSKSIVHRRLAMRNVLLKKEDSGLVAKLIGFGTFGDVGSDEDAPESNVAVPLKWLAPETLESVNRGKAVYTKMSDVWAYGITIWEIYSLGATPYPGKKSAEVEGLLKTGHRMPRPNDCPQELFDIAATPCWNAIPKKRPDFRTICRQIRDFRSGGANQDNYYAVDPKSKHYDDPKERTNDYISAKKTSSTPEELYDDTNR